MDLLHAKFRFRSRTAWESVDLGRKLIVSHLGYYTSLYAALMAPIFIISLILLHAHPLILLTIIWWLKPIYEYGILSTLSIHIFQPLPPLWSAIKTGYRLMFRRCVIGDLSWRRLRMARSFVLPIQQLEHLQGSNYHLRVRELSRYGSSTGTTLTLLGNALESIWLYSLLILVYWFFYGDFIKQGLVQPSHMQEFSHLIQQLWHSWINDESADFFHYSAWAYYVVLAFWGPFYIASGFTLYLHARIQAEAWDIRLTWQQLGERLGKSISWCLVLISCLVLSFSYPNFAAAESLPSDTQITQSRQEVLQKAPYYHLKTENRWCWLSCDKTKSNTPQQPLPSNQATPNIAILQTLGYVVLAVLIIGLLWLLIHWLKQKHWNTTKTQQADTLPTTLFGLDVRTEALPKNVSEQAQLLMSHNPRAGLSLLYRATLAQIIEQQQLPIRQYHTEGHILQLINSQLPMLNPYFANLTTMWLHTAYGHQSLPVTPLIDLCQQYAVHFEYKGRL